MWRKKLAVMCWIYLYKKLDECICGWKELLFPCSMASKNCIVTHECNVNWSILQQWSRFRINFLIIFCWEKNWTPAWVIDILRVVNQIVKGLENNDKKNVIKQDPQNLFSYFTTLRISMILHVLVISIA